jgi:hypothetical protein
MAKALTPATARRLPGGVRTDHARQDLEQVEVPSVRRMKRADFARNVNRDSEGRRARLDQQQCLLLEAMRGIRGELGLSHAAARVLSFRSARALLTFCWPAPALRRCIKRRFGLLLSPSRSRPTSSCARRSATCAAATSACSLGV